MLRYLFTAISLVLLVAALPGIGPDAHMYSLAPSDASQGSTGHATAGDDNAACSGGACEVLETPGHCLNPVGSCGGGVLLRLASWSPAPVPSAEAYHGTEAHRLAKGLDPESETPPPRI